MANLTLSPSPYLITVPDVDLVNGVILTPASYASWAACFAANTSKTQFLVTAGDYTSWGLLGITNKAGGSAGNYRIIRYYDASATSLVHPYDRIGGDEALVEAIQVSGPSSTYWMIHGLTTREPALGPNMMYDRCSNIVFDYLMMDGSDPKTYCARIRGVTDCTIQRCVIRNAANLTGFPWTGSGDSVGIQVGNIDYDVTGIKILDNEIFDCGDSIQLTDGPYYWRKVECRIEGNDLYMTDAVVDSAGETWGENAIDIKAGTPTASGIVINNNRMWGFRFNKVSTSLGEAIVVQRYARNIDITNNIIGDGPIGMKDENWLTTQTTFTNSAATNICSTATNHFLTTGAGPFKLVNTGGALPGGLATNTEYWAIVYSTTTLAWATSYNNALLGEAVITSTDGTGTNKFQIYTGTTRTVSVDGNQFHDITTYSTVNDAPYVFRAITDINYTNNTIARCDYMFDNSPTTYYGPVITGNTLTLVGDIQRPEDQTPDLGYDPDLNTQQAYLGDYYTYERKRWTGVETVDGAVTFAPPTPTPDPTPAPENPPDPDLPLVGSHRGGSSASANPTGSVSHRGNT